MHDGMCVGMRIFDDFIFMKPFIFLQTTIYFTLRKKVKVYHSLLTDTLFDGLLFSSKGMNSLKSMFSFRLKFVYKIKHPFETKKLNGYENAFDILLSTFLVIVQIFFGAYCKKME